MNPLADLQAALGEPMFLGDANVRRIAGRPDEHHRRRVPKLCPLPPLPASPWTR